MAVSIWKDYEVSFGAVTEADYTIETGGAEIYAGHAVLRPDESTLTVRINDVCADYLDHALPSVTTRTCTGDPCLATFTVKDGGGNTVDTVDFIADWSYNPSHTPTVLAAPVNGRVSAAQTLVASVVTSSAVSVVLTYKNGTTSTVSVAASAESVQAVSVPLTAFSNLASVTVGGNVYTVVDVCHRYALLYVNAFGGWDTLLMEGLSLETDSYGRYTMKQRYDNSVQSNRGTVEYVNEVTRSWTLRTGWLSDAAAARMHHLLGSPHVYLYDIVDGVTLPVVVTDDTCSYKTFRNNGAQMITYTVGVQLAHEMTRR